RQRTRFYGEARDVDTRRLEQSLECGDGFQLAPKLRDEGIIAVGRHPERSEGSQDAHHVATGDPSPSARLRMTLRRKVAADGTRGQLRRARFYGQAGDVDTRRLEQSLE